MLLIILDKIKWRKSQEMDIDHDWKRATIIRRIANPGRIVNYEIPLLTSCSEFLGSLRKGDCGNSGHGSSKSMGIKTQGVHSRFGFLLIMVKEGRQDPRRVLLGYANRKAGHAVSQVLLACWHSEIEHQPGVQSD